ncbi:cytidine deaminase [Hujiaoplasma nucleasis]|uniref:Cytidine deaminase n=1 Tax=Hujiaoplasma nucleasis TaxID=2725268 RepID=A0A7L6MZZ7_9MOLU|nr:cytidine deaminase [Hujiaoplasma nucleasis]QLY39570.1 cytidine deaminase [Hujiaoplasma nucleasis]
MKNEMLNEAIKIIENAYVPYSKFRVAAVLKLKNGQTLTGVNVENASYGLSNCAERTALFHAYAQGYRKEDIDKLLVYTDKEYFVSPCGACRQVMNELLESDAEVIMANSKGEMKSVKNKDLLPFGFSSEDL